MSTATIELVLYHAQTPTGTIEWSTTSDAGPWNAFRYCREVMRWMEETSKGVLSQPITNPTALAFLYPAVEEHAA